MSDPLPPALQRFLEWLPAAEPMGSVEPMLVQYREWLERRGATRDEAGAAIGEILRLMRQRPEGWPALFDRIYASPAPGYRTGPNALLVEAASSRTPGRALDVCSGEGRNAVWLAGQGWQVTGFDVSAEGIAVARRHAAAAGVSVTLVQQASSDFDYAAQEWDLVAVFYAPVPLPDPSYVDTLAGTMAPGGIVVVESFASAGSAPRRRPVDLDPDELDAAFAGFEIERLDDVIDDPDWIDRPERLVRMIARKPIPITI